MIEKLVAVYLLLVALNIWYIKNEHLFTAKRVIRLIGRWYGVHVYFELRTQLVTRDLTPSNLKRVKVEYLFTKDDEGYLQYLPKEEREQERFYNYTSMAGDQFVDFLNRNPQLIERIKRVDPRPRNDEELWRMDFWVHTEQAINFKN